MEVNPRRNWKISWDLWKTWSGIWSRRTMELKINLKWNKFFENKDCDSPKIFVLYDLKDLKEIKCRDTGDGFDDSAGDVDDGDGDFDDGDDDDDDDDGFTGWSSRSPNPGSRELSLPQRGSPGFLKSSSFPWVNISEFQT